MSAERILLRSVLQAWRKELELFERIVETSLEVVDEAQKTLEALDEKGDEDEGTA